MNRIKFYSFHAYKSLLPLLLNFFIFNFVSSCFIRLVYASDIEYYEEELITPKNFWNNPYSLLIALGLATFPRTTLLIATSIPYHLSGFFQICFFSVTFLFAPEITVLWGAINRGYHYCNRYELIFYFLCYLLSWINPIMKLTNSHQGSSNRNLSTIERNRVMIQSLLLYPSTNNIGLSQAFQTLVDALNALQKQISVQRRQIALLDADEKMLKSLNPSQLSFLKGEFEDRLQTVKDVQDFVKTRPCISSNSQSKFEKCAICLTENVGVQLRPCGHTCFCVECFADFTKQCESECPLCRIPILSFCYTQVYSQRVSVEEYEREQKEYTEKCIRELREYYEQNPHLVNTLYNSPLKEEFKSRKTNSL